jgi:hypothetical protein
VATPGDLRAFQAVEWMGELCVLSYSRGWFGHRYTAASTNLIEPWSFHAGASRKHATQKVDFSKLSEFFTNDSPSLH